MVQPENGTTNIANELAEALAKTQLSGYESRYLWVLWRKTYGWHKKDDTISNSQFVEATGLHKGHICRTEKRLISRKIVTKNGNKIAFNKDYQQWSELPKLVTVTKNGNKVTKIGSGVTNLGTKVTKNGKHKRNYTKQSLQKQVKALNTVRHSGKNNLPDGRIKQIIDLYFQAYKIKFNKPPVITAPKWGKTLIPAILRAEPNIEIVKKCIDAYLLDQDNFVVTNGYSFEIFYSRFQGYRNKVTGANIKPDGDY